jgi:hypothetical protein
MMCSGLGRTNGMTDLIIATGSMLIISGIIQLFLQAFSPIETRTNPIRI